MPKKKKEDFGFSLEDLDRIKRWAESYRKMAEESYWKTKKDDPKVVLYTARMEYYDGLLYKIQHQMDNLES